MIACAEAGDNESCQIFVTHGTKPTSRPPAKMACDPLALAQLLQHSASVSLDATVFKKKPHEIPESLEEEGVEYYGYRPDSSSLWRAVDLRIIVDKIDFASRPYVEKELQTTTKLPISTIEKVVDECKANNPGKFTEASWDIILHVCKVPRARGI